MFVALVTSRNRSRKTGQQCLRFVVVVDVVVFLFLSRDFEKEEEQEQEQERNLGQRQSNL